MAGNKRFVGAGVVGLLIASLVPTMALANTLNVNTGTHIPMRPHVNLNATINLGVKSPNVSRYRPLRCLPRR